MEAQAPQSLTSRQSTKCGVSDAMAPRDAEALQLGTSLGQRYNSHVIHTLTPAKNDILKEEALARDQA
eukprot:CAMPEP_0185213550 /NCGR_PEP_ID=MMETSP1140-20130426/68089_1 /TAXON_ID=298111 /ORGANISM="Pavlova sp., Strain CCMP459" /LENGTH=67 /DNA_ID=CAMNT_0027781409 /DNA_START=826 /DNA_END=1025 /DNA_ORIENTATION=+